MGGYHTSMDFSLYRYYYLFIKKESIYKERKKVTRDEHSGPLLVGAFILVGAGNKLLVGAGNKQYYFPLPFITLNFL